MKQKMRIQSLLQGPITYPDLQLLWKYHLVPEATRVRQAGEFAPIKDFPQFFSASVQIQHVDPTLLDS